MKKSLRACLVLSLVGATACAEGTATRPDSGRRPDTGTAMEGDSGTSDSGAGPTDGGSPPDTGLPPASGLVINELQPAGDEWVEIVNASATPISLSGYLIADASGLGGDPGNQTMFPADLILAAGEHFVVAMDESAPMPGVLTDSALCRGASRCVQTGFGLGNDGDSVGLVMGGTTVVQVDFPGVTAAGITAEQTHCRLPDVSGAFVPCAPTPGEDNVGP